MKIDIFNHIFPKTYFDKMMAVNPNLKKVPQILKPEGSSEGGGDHVLIWVMEKMRCSVGKNGIIPNTKDT